MLATSRRGRIARVARERFTFHHGAQTAPIVIVAAHNRDPLVLARGRINAMRRELRIGISDAESQAAWRFIRPREDQWVAIVCATMTIGAVCAP